MPYSKNILAFIILLLAAAVARSQVPGCTDPFASNYNAAATVNNGSCLYTAASYTPVIKVDPITDSLIESSGLQMAGGYLWSFNDKDGKPSLYRIDTITNTLLQRVILEGATNDDWEDIAFDGTYMYVGDFGNNYDGARTNLKIYKFLFSAIHDYTTHPADTVPAQQIQVINFKYSDQPQPPLPTGSNLTKFDCEAMIVLNGKIHLFSKNWIDNTSTHYIISDTSAGSYILAPLETLPTGYLVTAADKVAGQDIIVLLGYQNSGLGNHYMHILSGYNGDTLFAGNKRMISLGDATAMGQSEGLTFRNNKYGYISNEKFVRIVGPFTITVNQKLRSFDMANFVGNHFTKYIFTGNGNWSNAANWRYHAMPPPNILAGNEILIDPAANGACKLNIQYTIPAGAKLTVSTGKSFIVNGNLTVQ